MVYEWKAQSRINTDAQTAGDVCEQLFETVGLTAENLLNASREKNAPLHDEFEWNDTVAAENYRIEQARYIIRMLCVKKEEETETTQTRAFFTIEPTNYEPLEVILKSEDKTAVLLEQAMKELTAFSRKYSALKQLEPVFDAIKEVSA